jgi:hypothetical protein
LRRIVLPGVPRTVTCDAQVQRIVHRVLTGTDLNQPASEARDVIDCRLQRAVVGPNDIRIAQADSHSRAFLHLRMHRARKLTLIRARREV